jgi:glycosyltransferase involved in cell wall biosynthesis
VHPLDTILDAAEALKDDQRFVFAFVGGGKGKQAVEERVQRSEIRDQKSEKAISDSQNFKVSAFPKIISMPYQALNMIKYSLSAADLHIVSLGDNMSGIVHPCKIYGALSIGRPVLTLGPKDSYLSDILESNDIGWAIQHGDVTAAVTALKAAADQTQEERAAIGQRAQQVATEKFGRKQLVQQFLKTVLKPTN